MDGLDIADNQNDSSLLPESSFQSNTGINCFVLRSTKQFTYRMIPVFHWNDDSGKRQNRSDYQSQNSTIPMF